MRTFLKQIAPETAIEQVKMEEPTAQDDRELLQAAQRGDAAAFDRLVGRHLDRLYRFCVRLLGNEADAKEVCMDTLLAAHRRLHWLRAEPSIAPWLFRAASRRCWRALRRNQRRRKLESAAVAEALGESPRSPAEAACAESDAQFMRECLGRLPERHRLPLALRFVEDQDFDEMAKALRCSPAQARLRVHRALKRLEKVYREREGLAGLGLSAGARAVLF